MTTRKILTRPTEPTYSKEQLMHPTRIVTLALPAASFILMLCGHEPTAAARTVSAVNGNPQEIGMSGVTPAFFISVSGGVRLFQNQPPGPLPWPQGDWYVALPFDTGGQKTLTVRGKADVGGSMACRAWSIQPTGGANQVTSYTSFPANGVYTTITLTLTNVVAGGFAYVQCRMSGIGTNHGLHDFLGVDYNQ